MIVLLSSTSRFPCCFGRVRFPQYTTTTRKCRSCKTSYNVTFERADEASRITGEEVIRAVWAAA